MSDVFGKTVYFQARGLFFNYRRAFEVFKNKYFNDEEWLCKSAWFVFIQIRPSFFELEDFYYDGHTINGITILGVSLGYGYTYDSRSCNDWNASEVEWQA